MIYSDVCCLVKWLKEKVLSCGFLMWLKWYKVLINVNFGG